MVLALADDLGAECSDCTLAEELVIVLLNVNLLLDLINTLYSNIASLFEAVSNLQWVNTLVKKFLSLIKEGSSKNDNTSGSITDLIILRL